MSTYLAIFYNNTSGDIYSMQSWDTDDAAIPPRGICATMKSIAESEVKIAEYTADPVAEADMKASNISEISGDDYTVLI